MSVEDTTKKDPAPSPGTNSVDDNEHETFLLGRPVDDNPEVESCKHCKKNVLKSGARVHIAQCLRVKKEKAQRKKEAREARERAREAAREEEARKADEDGGRDDDSDDEDGDNKAGKGSKTNRDVGKGKKRKVDGEAEKGPFRKRKKEDAKPKAAKPKGWFAPRFLPPDPSFLFEITWAIHVFQHPDAHFPNEERRKTNIRMPLSF